MRSRNANIKSLSSDCRFAFRSSENTFNIYLLAAGCITIGYILTISRYTQIKSIKLINI